MRNILLPVFVICLSLTCFGQLEQLANTTIGFSTGVSVLGASPKDYSLDPGSNKLVIQKLSSASFVISSTLTIKFDKLGTQVQGVGSNRKRIFVRMDQIETEQSTDDRGNISVRNKKNPEGEDLYAKAHTRNRLAFNVALNLAEISSGNVSFNKPIDGGIGLGYFVSPSIQTALFFDIIRIRQMRNYIVNNYEGKPIPKGMDYYNALDPADNNLFFNKTFSGISFKVIIALNPKK